MSIPKPAMPDLAVTLLGCKQRDQEAREQTQVPDADPFELSALVTDNTFVLREIVGVNLTRSARPPAPYDVHPQKQDGM